MELADELHARIEELSLEGSALYDASQMQGAIQKWTEAIDLLPEPRGVWEAFTWLSGSIGDAQYQLGDFDAARHSFLDALNDLDGQENPFLHYRLGQCLFRLGDESGGVESLLKAYMLDGKDIFSRDPEGPECMRRLRERGLIQD